MMIDYFGYLDMDYSVSFGDVRITPIEEYNNVKAWVKQYLNEDGFIYPPMEHRIEINIETMKEKRVIPNTERPSQLHKIPSSHSIEIKNSIKDVDLRKWDYAFLINMLALLNGTRVQFHNWWFDGRISIRNMDNIYISQQAIADFLSTVYDTWKGFGKPTKENIINILVMHNRILHNRIPTYEWDFERFLLNYIVFDGAFQIAKKSYNCKARSHKDQFLAVIDRFGIAKNIEHINKIYNLRNDLFHYAIWDGGYPSSPADKYKGWIQEIALRKFNIRLLVALLNYKTDFIKTPWWTIDTFPVDSRSYK